MKVIRLFLLIFPIAYGKQEIFKHEMEKGPLDIKVLQEGFLFHFRVCVCVFVPDRP